MSYSGWLALRNVLLVCFLALAALSVHKLWALDDCHDRGGQWAFYHCELP